MSVRATTAHVRVDEAAVLDDPYPEECSLDADVRWGLAAGWATALFVRPIQLPGLEPGDYELELRVAERYRSLLDAPRSLTLALTVTPS